jgi:hypothetical protein
MRTTLSLDEDVAALIEGERKRTDKSLKDIVNTALRRGLREMKEPKPREPFQTTVFQTGECLLPSLDCIADVLEEIEGPSYK